MPLFLSFCNNQVFSLVNQLGTNPLSKHSFNCNLTLWCKLLKFFNQNPRTKSGPGDFQFGIIPSIFFKLSVVISIFFCFLKLTSIRKSCNHFASFLWSADRLHLFPQNCFDSSATGWSSSNLLPDLIPYKTVFDYFQIACFVYSYLPALDTF